LSQKCITYIDLIDDNNLAAEIIAKRGRRSFMVKTGDTMDMAKKAGSTWGAQIQADIMAWAMDRVINGRDDKFGAAISSFTKGFVKALSRSCRREMARQCSGIWIGAITRPESSSTLSLMGSLHLPRSRA
jgi:hypothetical protein